MSTFRTRRDIAASPEQVFAAMSDPQRLARWWGPAGFTNTFNVCEFKVGGRWSFVMHGPDGGRYANESVFAEIDAPRKVAIHHVSEPRFLLTISLEPSATGTVISWNQAFENAETARRVEHIVVPSNEENLDRLQAEVLNPPQQEAVMKTFLAIFTGTPESMARWGTLSEKERNERQAAGVAGWHAWAEKHKAVILDLGGPLGKTKLVSSAGVSDIRNSMTAYSLLKAESHEAAARLFENHPHFTIFPGDGVEVMECLPIPGA